MTYKRTVDKAEIPICNIMGVNIAAINMKWLLDYLEKNLSNLKGDYICVSNVHTTVTSYEEPSYCAIQNGGIMAIPDGGPLSSLGRKRGFVMMERTTGPSLMGELFKISAKRGYRHYFYGSTEETLEKLKNKLQEYYPEIQIIECFNKESKDFMLIESFLHMPRIVRRKFEEDTVFAWIDIMIYDPMYCYLYESVYTIAGMGTDDFCSSRYRV